MRAPWTPCGRLRRGEARTSGAVFSTPSLEELRRKIDGLDRAIARSVLERILLSRRVALLKLVRDLPWIDLERENQIEEELLRFFLSHGLPKKKSEEITHHLFRALVRPLPWVSVAIQGGKGSFSDETLRETIPRALPLYQRTFEEAFGAALEGRALAVWAPLWNSTIGEIREVTPHLLGFEEWVVEEFPIRLALLARSKIDLEEIERIEGHPRALDQCRRTLGKILPHVRIVESEDGAFSLERLDPTQRVAVVGNPSLAYHHGGHVLLEGIEDERGNRTRFALLVPRSLT